MARRARKQQQALVPPRWETPVPKAAIARGDEAGYFELNLAFHDRIADAAGTHRTRALYVSLGKEVRLMRLRSHLPQSCTPQSLLTSQTSLLH